MRLLDRYLQKVRIRQAGQYIPSNSRLLDIGSGTGELFKIHSARIVCGLGIDPLLETEVQYEKYKLVPGSFPKDLPPGSVFDVITALAVFEHMPADEKGPFAEMCFALLEKTGVVILTVPSTIVDHILKILIFFRLAEGMSLDEHHGFHPKGTIPIFQNANFELIEHRKFQFGLNNLFVFRK